MNKKAITESDVWEWVKIAIAIILGIIIIRALLPALYS